MAELNIFHYLPGNSMIHQMDGRIKLLCLVLLSITTGIIQEISGFVILTSMLLIVLIKSQLPLIVFLKEMKYFTFWMIIIVLAHSLSIPGAPIPFFPLSGLTREGIISGMMFAWRLVLIILMSTVFTGTTTLATLRNVIEWYMRPVGLLPAARVGAILSLTFVLLPLIFDQASEILNAQRARCIENRRNPIQRIRFFTIPLFLQMFSRADEIAFAMDARCYSELRTQAVFKTTAGDWLSLILTGVICLTILTHPWRFYL